MLLNEALFTQKPFRRESIGGNYFSMLTQPGLLFDADEVQADDWELDENMVFISEDKHERLLQALKLIAEGDEDPEIIASMVLEEIKNNEI